jgi:SNF family Na+-dependent transporter
MAIAQSGSFNLGFATMPVVFQQLPLGNVLGFMWFALLFFAGITSSVAMLTPITAFFREEFGVGRERVSWILGGFCFVFGLMHIIWLQYGFLEEWDYWAGTFGLVVLATIEVVLFVWIYRPENMWRELHEGADIRIPRIFKFIMTYVTPLYLLFILVWWGVSDALPILRMEKSAGGGTLTEAMKPYILTSRGVIVLFFITFALLVRVAWKRNGYDDRKGFVLVDHSGEGGQP